MIETEEPSTIVTVDPRHRADPALVRACLAGGLEYAGDLNGLPATLACASGGGIVVAVLDTGVDTANPALARRVLSRGYNVLDGSATTLDWGHGIDDDGDGFVDEMSGHGTHVAGIVARVAPNATILPVKVLDSDGVGDAFFLAAPGMGILSTVPSQGYGSWSGTSMATPFVAAAAALLLGESPDLTPDEVRSRLVAGAADIDAANSNHAGALGAGRLDAAAAVGCR